MVSLLSNTDLDISILGSLERACVFQLRLVSTNDINDPTRFTFIARKMFLGFLDAAKFCINLPLLAKFCLHSGPGNQSNNGGLIIFI